MNYLKIVGPAPNKEQDYGPFRAWLNSRGATARYQPPRITDAITPDDIAVWKNLKESLHRRAAELSLVSFTGENMCIVGPYAWAHFRLEMTSKPRPSLDGFAWKWGYDRLYQPKFHTLGSIAGEPLETYQDIKDAPSVFEPLLKTIAYTEDRSFTPYYEKGSIDGPRLAWRLKKELGIA